jgi:outer membrane protein assembly factor BamB
MASKRWPLASGAAAAVAFVVIAACSSDFANDTKRPNVDASADAPLVPDTAPPDPDAPAPVGDICGDRAGLQASAVWPMLGGCPKRASYSYRPATYATTLRWFVGVPAAESSPALTAEGFLWVGTTDGRAIALSATFGNLLTSVKLGDGPVRSSPAIAANGRALFGYGDFVYPLPISNGTLPIDGGADADADAGANPTPTTPALDAEGPVASSVNVTNDGSIIVATTNGRVAALRQDGAPKWSIVTDGDGVASPAIGSNGRIYVAGAGNALVSLDPETGAKMWQAPIGAPVRFIGVGGDDTVYAAPSAVIA